MPPPPPPSHSKLAKNTGKYVPGRFNLTHRELKNATTIAIVNIDLLGVGQLRTDLCVLR